MVDLKKQRKELRWDSSMGKHRTWTYDGRQSHPLYRTWRAMITRCHNENCPEWKYYGGRGIKICDRWYDPINGFFNFVEDMGERPEGFTLDRIDCDGDYRPENCRWATKHQQIENRRIKSNTGFLGISYDKRHKHYLAEVNLGSMRKRERKCFKKLNEAIAWRRQKEEEIYKPQERIEGK